MRKINLQTGAVSSIVAVPAGSPTMIPAGLDLVGSHAYIGGKSHHSIKHVDWQIPDTCHDLVGNGVSGLNDGIGTNAQFYEPTGVAISLDGKFLLVADSKDHSVRWVDLDSLESEDHC
ncbi:hypothetical protein GUITHDRAFT_111833 [Guillardia theta CCMP2712]|uniref:Uncharacterized protein n=1 Tax=Guillardia theta (strain CCMP2712) TaxID=905079 RepID=L1J199_GUITC|nr:hypothetical protein GUITHDRAFT_111833 [Guillardia theta CCMP2712]EKX42271.1 hypothetical protein GUITHDRAFT_111833 [Guillardia theta CCMP2712]|eukprot:XP_005829251.1 hypothetical protein GUITHDRAFT_111833 [Guillardia theta CCMP2712]